MVIAIDIRPLIGGNTSGVEIYIRQLLEHLLLNNKNNTYILYLNSFKNKKDILKEFQQAQNKNTNIKILHTRIPNKIFNLALSLLRWPKLDSIIQKKLGIKPDIFLIPDLRPAPISKNTKKISVIHDLAYHHFPSFFSLKTRLWYALINPKKEIHESNKLIAVSSFTKKDIANTYKIPSNEITVIHQGINENFPHGTKKLLNIPPEYFLFLSTLEPRKNIKMLIKAFNQFKNENNSNIKLVIAGKQNKKIFAKIPEIRSNEIILTGFINEEDKASLYTHAKAFIYPSIFEGFGLPLLEAMKCGTPIITSNTSSMPEVVEEAAILIDPHSQSDLAKAMTEILKPETRKTLQTKMEEQIKKFSWEKCARETQKVFTSLSLEYNHEQISQPQQQSE